MFNSAGFSPTVEVTVNGKVAPLDYVHLYHCQLTKRTLIDIRLPEFVFHELPVKLDEVTALWARSKK